MAQRPTRGRQGPIRSSRPRSSVIGPPPGSEAGTGYISPSTSPTTYQFPRPPPREPPREQPPVPPSIPTSSLFRSIGRNSRGRRPDSSLFEPIMEEPPSLPRRSSRRRRRRDASSSETPTVMFYPSTTTVSSVESDPVVEPMPFFRTDTQLRESQVTASPRQSAPSAQGASESQGRATSTTSSGVLGVSSVVIELDPSDESGEEENTSTSSSSEGQLVRGISTVRRGRARIIRNPSARRSVVPEVRKFNSQKLTSRSVQHLLLQIEWSQHHLHLQAPQPFQMLKQIRLERYDM
jgi:hypothetical protein